MEYADYLLPFELLYHDMHNLDITNEKKDVFKTPLTLTPEEFAALKSLLKNKNLVI